MRSILSGTGEFIQGTNANLKISGTSTINTLTATSTGNNVDFNSSLEQIINPGTYYNLLLGNKIQNGAYIDADSSGTVTIGDTRIFIGNGLSYSVGSVVTISDTDIGTIIVLPTGTGNLKKTGTNSSQFVYGTDNTYVDVDKNGTVSAGDIRIPEATIVASGDLIIGTVIVLPTGANNLKKTDSANIVFVYSHTDNDTLSGDTTVNNSLSLGGVKLSTGVYKIILGIDAVVSHTLGYIIGTIKKYFVTSSLFTFTIGDANSYYPVNLTLNNLTNNSSLDVSTNAIDRDQGVNRSWTLTNNGLTFGSYDVTFNFNTGDIDSGITPTNMTIFKDSIGISTTCAQTSCTATSLSSMSDFQIGMPAPTPTPTPTPTSTPTPTPTLTPTPTPIPIIIPVA